MWVCVLNFPKNPYRFLPICSFPQKKRFFGTVLTTFLDFACISDAKTTFQMFGYFFWVENLNSHSVRETLPRTITEAAVNSTVRVP
jgi:hypothetical protein